MEDNMHDVVKLLIARMESHPEEFVPPMAEDQYIMRDTEGNRWWRAMHEVQEFGSNEEKEVIAAKLRVLRLRQAHEWMMDELCNGDERRRKQRIQEEMDKQRYAAAQQPQAPYIHNMTTALQQQMDYQKHRALSELSALGNYTVSTDMANDTLVIRNQDTRDTVAIPHSDLATDNSPLTTIKKALGLK